MKLFSRRRIPRDQEQGIGTRASGEVLEEIGARDLPIALYLNQRITFDLLASFEGGFAQITTVQESSSHSEKSGLAGGAGLGVSNPFALLSFSMGAKGHRGKTRQSSGTTTEERVHTPTSLFARLRKELFERKLVKTIEGDGSNFDHVEPGGLRGVPGSLAPLTAG